MRIVEKYDVAKPLNVNDERKTALQSWLLREVEDAISASQRLHAKWRDAMRMYEGVPRQPVRNVPVENAPNIEIPLGAIATDAIYAQALDLIFTSSPLITVRAMNEKGKRNGAWKALQRFVDWGAGNEWNVRRASEHTLFDNVQLGTGAYYIPYVKYVKRTKAAKVTHQGPRIFSLPVEDILVPGGAYEDLQVMRLCGFRQWYTEGELVDQANENDWDIEHVQAVGAVGFMRSRREQLGGSMATNQTSELFEIFKLFVYFDIDNDGFDEDLEVVYDRTSRSLLKICFNRYDHRPLEHMCYQIRAHMFYGVGVMDMIKSFQEEATEIHNHRVLNMFLANARVWKAKTGSVPDNMKIWGGKVIEMSNPDDLKPEQMGEVYPSAPQSEAITVSLAERRVGVNELSTPRPSAVLGSRTPGITAMTLMQQVNRRFTPAFDAMRNATANAVKQCLYRYQEQLLAGDTDAEGHILDVLGHEDGQLVINLLRDEKFDEAVAVELTASSARANREADKQSSLQLVGILSTYYERTLMLVSIAANPQTPEPVRDVARKIATSSAEIIDRTIRTFDQMRDPEAFIVRVDEELDKIEGLNDQGMLGLANLVNGVAGMMGGLGPGGGGDNGSVA